eukprot:g523.t1
MPSSTNLTRNRSEMNEKVRPEEKSSKVGDMKSSGPQDLSFSIQLVYIDFFLTSDFKVVGNTPPNSKNGGTKSNPTNPNNNAKVPVIRIYGRIRSPHPELTDFHTSSQQPTNSWKPFPSVCVHLHGALPYFFIRCADVGTMDVQKLHNALEKLLQSRKQQETFRKQRETYPIYAKAQWKPKNGTSSASKQQQIAPFIHSLIITRGKCFYGYHSANELFFQVRYRDPASIYFIQRVLGSTSQDGDFSDDIEDELDERNIIEQESKNIKNDGNSSKDFRLSLPLQTYESHVPFLLQVKIDLHLAGMDWVHFTKITGYERVFCCNGISRLVVKTQISAVLNASAASVDVHRERA